MGLAIHIPLFLRNSESLGWSLIIASAVVVADGAICWSHGQGQWSHREHAPLILVVGVLIFRTDRP